MTTRDGSGEQSPSSIASDHLEPDETESENKEDDDEFETYASQKGHLVLEARECKYFEFKESVQGETKYVLDILLAGNEMENDILAWNALHLVHSSSDRGIDSKEESYESDTASAAQMESTFKAERDALLNDPVDDWWIRPIRINSVAVVDILWRFTAEAGLSKPANYSGRYLIFEKPFSLMTHCHMRMRDELEALNARVKTE